MRTMNVEKKPLFFEEEKLSPEEKKYRSAQKLMESVDCVVRFETAVESLNSASALFEALGNYKESARQAERCKKLAIEKRETGIREAYQETLILMENARTKVDYRTVISEFERFPDYKDSRERIEECKKILRRIASRQAWRNRGIAVLLLTAITIIFWISPAKPYSKGLIRMEQGQYLTALIHFKKAGDFLNAPAMKKRCYAKQAQLVYEEGDLERAMRLCRKADGRSDADILLTKIEIENMRKAKKGDTVIFGKGAWQILESDGDKRLLLSSVVTQNRPFAADTNKWASSTIRRWMNKSYRKQLLNQGERRLLLPVDRDIVAEDKTQDKLFLLNSEEYGKYASIITPVYLLPESSTTEKQFPYLTHSTMSVTEPLSWWLQDAGTNDDAACFVDTRGARQTNGAITDKKGVRPAIEIMLDETLLEDTPETASPSPN